MPRSMFSSLPILRRTALRLWRATPSHHFTSYAADPVQVYISSSTSPTLNLSIEHALLQKSHPNSTILFLYTNRPCIIIGRNQNPWVEVNMPLLARLYDSSTKESPEPPRLVAHPECPEAEVELVRRRSGGGAVFHDSGNINFSVICPSATFDRDKHAHMVVRALHSLGVPTAQVNCRHDIIIATDSSVEIPQTSAGTCKAGIPGTFKVSGSAYKLTRLRALHHGTCLLGSPNLGGILGLLTSPGRPWIEARGVESVRSPVRNVGVEMDEFREGILREWSRMYGEVEVKMVGEGEAGHPEVVKGVRELKSRDWIYGQTPRFKFDSTLQKDPLISPKLGDGDSISFESNHGELDNLVINGQSLELAGKKKLYDITDWSVFLREHGVESGRAGRIGEWASEVLGSEWTARGL